MSSAQLTCHQRRCLGTDLHACATCDEAVPRSVLSAHEAACLASFRQEVMDGKRAMQAARLQLRTDGLLTDKQLAALQHVERSSVAASDVSRPALLSRVQRLGFCEADQLKAERFIREHAPLVIHVNLDTPKLLQSDRYCSLFETGRSTVRHMELRACRRFAACLRLTLLSLGWLFVHVRAATTKLVELPRRAPCLTVLILLMPHLRRNVSSTARSISARIRLVFTAHARMATVRRHRQHAMSLQLRS